jgi:hypothetical protein
MQSGRIGAVSSDSGRFESVLNATAGSGNFPGVSFTLEWREGVSERQPSPTAWRSVIDARFERGEPLVDHVVIKPAEETAYRAGFGWLRR